MQFMLLFYLYSKLAICIFSICVFQHFKCSFTHTGWKLSPSRLLGRSRHQAERPWFSCHIRHPTEMSPKAGMSGAQHTEGILSVIRMTNRQSIKTVSNGIFTINYKGECHQSTWTQHPDFLTACVWTFRSLNPLAEGGDWFPMKQTKGKTSLRLSPPLTDRTSNMSAR